MEKKKVLVFLNEFPVLSETFIERDLRELVSFGRLDIDIVFTKLGDGFMSETVSKHSHQRRLTWKDSIFAIKYFLTKPKLVLSAFKIVLGDNSKSLIQRKFLFLKCVGYTKIFEEFSPDEIHAHFLTDTSTIAMVAAQILGIPFSINAHARDVTEYPTLPSQKCKLAKFISVCNRNAYNVCCSYCKDHSNVYLIHHSLSLEVFNVPTTMDKPEIPVIFPGGTRLTKKKGIRYVIEASKMLKDRGIAHRIDIVGGGPLYDELKKLVEELGVEKNVIFYNEGKGTPFSEVLQFYKIADIFVLPTVNLSSGDADGIPNTMLEAAFNKLPIVTTDAGSVKEIIQNDISGIIVPQENSYEIANAIERLIFNLDLRRALGEKAFEVVSETFSKEKTIRQLELLLLK